MLYDFQLMFKTNENKVLNPYSSQTGDQAVTNTPDYSNLYNPQAVQAEMQAQVCLNNHCWV